MTMLAALAEISFHGIDPVLLDLPGPLDVRWYGLTYVIGFLAGSFILERLNRRGFIGLKPEGPADLLLWLLIGVVVGGRVGYTLFYKPEILSNPLKLFAIWEGGMSFHGGLLGVLTVLIVFAHRQRISAFRLADSLALAVTPGIFAVRGSNFINGELYGRVTDASVPWAMRFPTDPVAARLLGLGGADKRAEELKILEALEPGGLWDKIKSQVPLRHPSQVYEGLAEGLLLGLILFVVYRIWRNKPLGFGRYAGIFLIGYGCFRWVIEFFRQPDAQFADKPGELGTVLGPLTMGQILCSAMIVGGLWLLLRRSQSGDPRLDPPSPSEA